MPYRVCSSKHGIHVATDDNELLLQNVGKRDSENEKIGKDKGRIHNLILTLKGVSVCSTQ